MKFYIQVALGATLIALALSIVFSLPPATPANVRDVPGTTMSGTTITTLEGP